MTDRQPEISIRAAGPADADILSRVGAESFAAAYQATTTAEDIVAHIDAHFSSTAIRDAMANTSCHYLLASVDAEPAGLLKLRDNPCPVEIPDKAAAEIQLVYILPGFQRLGLGARLIDAAIRRAGDQGLNSVWLSAWEHADWALNFYLKAGFRRVGTQEFRVGATAYTDHVMWLPFD